MARVIARPFTGEYPDYVRTQNRHDYSVKPTRGYLLDKLAAAGYDVIGVGKIGDIFAGEGITQSYPVKGNKSVAEAVSEIAKRSFHGLCFANFVDFDMLYGHRNDADGYASALSNFDLWLGKFMSELKSGDLLIITADHGCDPKTPSTDHSREAVPLLVYAENLASVNLETIYGFDKIGIIAADALGMH
ncbi:Phosphopentomutase [bioreactor metagenome]|uniref:Phosphopentomutase n=1 Tax=bioreactor metagenome TaxID=1076179 RepID=A0A645HVQ4_9ZZZZ